MSPEFENTEQDWFIPEDGRKHLQDLFKGLKDPVAMEMFTQKGEQDPFNEYLEKFTRDLTRLSDKITVQAFAHDSDQAKKREILATPALLIQPDKYHIRFYGAPLGEEGRAFIETIVRVSMNESGFSPVVQKVLAELDEERDVKVFVSPSCPYCPGQTMNAFHAAIERPELVRAACVETSQNPDLAEKYNVGSVPHTVINETMTTVGLLPEDRFAAELVSLETAEEDEPGQAPQHDHGPEVKQVDMVIVGAGPAGLTAGIYSERSGMSSVILEKDVIGGQVAVTPVVENYPGFANVPGQKLMEIMSQHAREYTDIHEGEGVDQIKVGTNLEIYTKRAVYVAKALLLCTGATWKKLGVPGEDRYFGQGVSYCSTCDGYLYKGKKAVVVGGGNTALTDALHLKNIGVDVSLIHRRDEFRAEKHLQESVERESIPVIWNTEVLEILSKDNEVTGVKLRNNTDDTTSELEVDAVFVAIGLNANTQLAKQVGLKLDDKGYIEVDRGMRTSIPRIYAAGDVTGGVQQIVTAIGEGSAAALSAFEDMSNPYWKKG